jgi:hypothetical protein
MAIVSVLIIFMSLMFSAMTVVRGRTPLDLSPVTAEKALRLIPSVRAGMLGISSFSPVTARLPAVAILAFGLLNGMDHFVQQFFKHTFCLLYHLKYI